MKYPVTILALMAVFFTGIVHASEKVPYTGQINLVQNYNRITPYIAISGLVGADGAAELAIFNFKTIIDMRTGREGTDEEVTLVKAEGMDYINIPITVKGISEEQLAEFTKQFELAEKPILIHCNSGNRAGAMWATYQISKGIDPEKAIAQGRKAGMRPAYEEKIRAAMLGQSIEAP